MITAIIEKMTRIILCCLFFFLFLTFYCGAEPVDIITLVDTSSSMESCFHEVIAYLIDDLLSKGVHINDTLHLIQFSGRPIHELSQKIEDSQSLSAIIKEIMFLKEKVLFGRHTDVVKALEELYFFAANLSPSHQKRIYILSDIQHDPPASSPYFNRDPELVKYALSRSTEIVREYNNWYVFSIRIPKDSEFLNITANDTSHYQADNFSTYSDDFHDNTEYHSFTDLIGLLGIGDEDFQPPAIDFPHSFQTVVHEDESHENRVFFINNRGLKQVQFLLPFLFGFFIIILVVLSIIIIARKKKLEGSFKDIFDTRKWQENLASFLGNDVPLIEMRVSFQNPHIGFRNIHRMKENKNMSIGGGLSQFLIFLIPMPTHIAELYRENGKYIFNPLQKEYFPDIKGPVIDCLNKEIPVVSRHGYRSIIVFQEYISPLSQLHTLLHSIKYGAENTKDLFHTHKLALSALLSEEVL